MGDRSVSAKDTAIGTAKQIVAEIVGDGRLAEEGSRQAANAPSADGVPRSDPSTPATATTTITERPHMDEIQFASLLGRAALKVWPDLPRDAQEQLFAAAVDDGVIASSLAEYLHDHHPRTAHPPRPTRLA
jgi:hypothetical protein